MNNGKMETIVQNINQTNKLETTESLNINFEKEKKYRK